MKKFGLISLFLSFVIFSFAQMDTWQVRAIKNNGDFIDLKAIDDSGTQYDIVALVKSGDLQLMDVKALKNGKLLPVKMLVSDEFYVPVKAIDNGGVILKVKAIDTDGTLLDVKGVSRMGNMTRIAAIQGEDNFLAIKAIDPNGNMRDIYGIKFTEEFVEMEIYGVKVTAHIKALPAAKTTGDHPVWNVISISSDGNSLDVVAIDQKGKEHPIKAMPNGTSTQMLNIKALVHKNKLDVKLLKVENKISLVAIDDVGRTLEIKAKDSTGKFLDIKGITKGSHIIDIKAVSATGEMLGVKAISPSGDLYDVKGVKVKDVDFEGSFVGFVKTVPYYAHVKGLPPIQ
jgi:hypothetical protein